MKKPAKFRQADSPLVYDMAVSGPSVMVAPLLSVTYRSGPPEIQFCGRRWVRGVRQEVMAQEWAAMQARPDCAGFDFQLIEE